MCSRRSAIGKSTPLFVGLDVHKDSIAVAQPQAASADPPVFLGRDWHASGGPRQLIRRLQGKTHAVAFGYEAGPCGYVLYRVSDREGPDCQVVAPSLIPKKPGDKREDRQA